MLERIVKILLVTSFLLMTSCSSEKAPVEEKTLDLRDFSDTMAYSQLLNIIKDPTDYLGDRIILTGVFTAPFNGFSHEYNYTITIQDNTQCCAQGIEFMPKKKMDYPDDFPGEGEMLSISGILTMFEEGKHGYVYIADAELIEEISG